MDDEFKDEAMSEEDEAKKAGMHVDGEDTDGDGDDASDDDEEEEESAI